MNIKKFKEVVGPTMEQVKKEKLYTAYGLLRPLAELLVKFYERQLTETEAQKGRCDDDN